MSTVLPLLPFVITREWNDYSEELASGSIEFFASGTTVHAITYQDYQGTQANANPVPLDLGGAARIWLVAGQVYDVVVYDASGLQIRKIIGVSAGIGGSGSSNFTVVANYAALRNIEEDVSLVYVQGRSTANDGGQGFFYRLNTTVDSDDDGIILVHGSVRYKRLLEDWLDPRWYGTVYGSSTDQYNTVTNALSAATTYGLMFRAFGKIYLTQDIHLTHVHVGFAIGGGFAGSGVVYFDTESYLDQPVVGCFANSAGNAPVHFNAGSTNIVNPNWFDTDDDTKLAWAQSVSAAINLWDSSVKTVKGWSTVEPYQHSPGNTLPVSGALSTPIANQAVAVSLTVARPDTLQLANGDWVVGTAWSLDTSGPSYVFSHTKALNATPISLTTKSYAGLTYTVTYTVTNNANPDNANTVGKLTASFDGSVLQTVQAAGTSTYTATIQTVNPNSNLIFTPDATDSFYGEVTAISITTARQTYEDITRQATFTGAGWTGSQSLGWTHAVNQTAPLTATFPSLTAQEYTGTFTVARTTSLVDIVPTTGWDQGTMSWTSGNAWSGATSTGWYLTKKGDVKLDSALVSSRTITPLKVTVPTINDKSKYRVTVNCSSWSYGKLSVMLGGDIIVNNVSAQDANHPTQWVVDIDSIATNAELSISCDWWIHYEHPSGSSVSRNFFYYFDGIVTVKVECLNSGVLTASFGGTAVVVNENDNLIKNSGTYTFRAVGNSLTPTFAITPTAAFDGIVSGISIAPQYVGSVAVYVGSTLLGIADASKSYQFRSTQASGSTISFVPSVDFDGTITTLTAGEPSNEAVVKLTDTYTVTQPVNITAPLDPYQGLLNITTKLNITATNLIRSQATQWLDFASLDCVGISNFGSTYAYPEWAGAEGDGTSDDAVSLLFALQSGAAFLSHQYFLKTSLTTTSNVSLYSDTEAITATSASHGLHIGNQTTLTLGSLYADSMAIIIDAQASLIATGNISLNNTCYNAVQDITKGSSGSCVSLTLNKSVVNAIRGVLNTSSGGMNESSMANPSTTIVGAPVAVIGPGTHCSITNSLTPKAVAGSYDYWTFNSPKYWAISVPQSTAVYFDHLSCVGSFVACTDATSIVTVGHHNINDQMMIDMEDFSLITTQDQANSNMRLLTNGLGVVHEQNPEGYPLYRDTYAGKALSVMQMCPTKQFNYTMAPDTGWILDSAVTMGYTQQADSFLIGGNSYGIIPWYFVDANQFYLNKSYSPNAEQRAATSAFSYFGGTVTLTLTSPSTGFNNSSVAFDLRYDGSNNGAGVNLGKYVRRGFMLPDTTTTATVTIKLPCMPQTQTYFNFGGNNIMYQTPVATIAGTNLMGTSLKFTIDPWIPRNNDTYHLLYPCDYTNKTTDLPQKQLRAMFTDFIESYYRFAYDIITFQLNEASATQSWQQNGIPAARVAVTNCKVSNEMVTWSKLYEE